MVHGYVSTGQSSKERAAQVLEADDWPSTGGLQDQQVLNRCVHAAVHLDAVKTRTSVWFGTEEKSVNITWTPVKVSAPNCTLLELPVRQYQRVTK